VKLQILLAICAILAGTWNNKAQAAPFDITGSYLGGTFNIDTVAGTLTSVDITYSSAPPGQGRELLDILTGIASFEGGALRLTMVSYS
jgi:hypothetical protein